MEIIKDSAGREYQLVNGTAYHKETPRAVVDALEHARANSYRIIVDYGDVKTGKSWGEVYDIAGYVGRSGGSIKIPLLVHNSRSLGGGGLLDHCILSIRTARGKKLLYSI